MIKFLNRFIPISQVFAVVPMLVGRLPDWYPEWTVSVAFLLGLIGTIILILALLIARIKRQVVPRPELIFSLILVALFSIETGFVVWALNEIGKGFAN